MIAQEIAHRDFGSVEVLLAIEAQDILSQAGEALVMG
jgi:hypothetical protein